MVVLYGRRSDNASRLRECCPSRDYTLAYAINEVGLVLFGSIGDRTVPRDKALLLPLNGPGEVLGLHFLFLVFEGFSDLCFLSVVLVHHLGVVSQGLTKELANFLQGLSRELRRRSILVDEAMEGGL